MTQDLPQQHPPKHHREHEEKYRKSSGERIFDWMTYGGIAGIGTFFVGLALAYKQTYGGGAPLYQGTVRALRRIGLSENAATKAAETTSLMHGGNVMVVPVAIAEHYKKPIVRGFNAMLNAPPDAQVEEAPRQSLGSLVKGRLLAWGVVFASLFTANELFGKTFTTFKDEFGELACKMFRRPMDHTSKTYRYGQIAALDIFATITSAVLLYLGSRFFAKRAREKREAKTHIPEHAGHEATTAPITEAAGPEAKTAEEKPTATVNHARHEAALAATAAQPSPPGL